MAKEEFNPYNLQLPLIILMGVYLILGLIIEISKFF